MPTNIPSALIRGFALSIPAGRWGWLGQSLYCVQSCSEAADSLPSTQNNGGERKLLPLHPCLQLEPALRGSAGLFSPYFSDVCVGFSPWGVLLGSPSSSRHSGTHHRTSASFNAWYPWDTAPSRGSTLCSGKPKFWGGIQAKRQLKSPAAEELSARKALMQQMWCP